MTGDKRVRSFDALCSILCALVLVAACAVVFAAGMPASAVAAPDSASAEADAPVVRIGYYENEVFQEGASPDAVKTGYAYEYYRKLSEYTGWTYEYVYGDYADMYQKLLDGEVDLLAGLAWKEDRVGLIGYPEVAMGSETYSLVKHDADLNITSDPASLTGAKIGVLDSAMVGVLNAYLADHGVVAEVQTFNDYAELFAAFDNRKLDVLAAEGDGAYDRPNAEVITAFGASDYYLCVSAARPDLLTELNAAQTQLLVDEPNYIDVLHSKYYQVSVSSKAFTESERAWLDAHDTLRVGYLDNYLPYSDTNSSGAAAGLVQDVTPKIVEALGLDGLKLTYTGYGNSDQMVAALGAGDIDAVFPVGGGLYYSEMSGIYQSMPVVSTTMVLVYKGDRADTANSRFAANENNRIQYYYIKTNFPDAEIVTYPSIEDCLAAVESGKADFTTLGGSRANEILKRREFSDLSLQQLGQSDERCYGVKIGNEGLLKLLNRGIKVIGEDYAINQAHLYTDALYVPSVLDVVLDNFPIFAVLGLLVAALVIAFLMRDSRRSKRQSAELASALAAAESANQAKTAFLNSMSHDIRTPMNAIVGFTALAEKSIDDKEMVRDYLGKISVSSEHLLALINDVLDMSRIESGKMTLEESEVNLPDLVEELRTIVAPDVRAKAINFTVNMEDVVNENVITDKLRLSQALLNILSNAIKFTPPEGRIELGIAEKPYTEEGCARFVFRVADSGIGMSEKFQETLFDPFTREQTSEVSGIQGTGLGMAITKNLVIMLGGSISVNSAEGEGSEFLVDLQFKIGEGSAAQPGEVSGAVDFTGRRILLAEDNELNQQIAVAILEDAGFAVEVAVDGAKALDMMKASPAGYYDAVLMDIQMPIMDGYEAARRIRELDDATKAQVPIVAITANAFEEDRKNVHDAGMNGHLAKPYDVPKMLGTLSELLGD